MNDDKKDPRAVLRAIERIAADVLDPRVPDGPPRRGSFSARWGSTPTRLGRRGADLAEKLSSQRGARRSARRPSAHAAPLAERVEAARGKPRRTRQEMLDRIARAEADPRFAGQIAVAARGRLPEEPTDEELAAMIATLDALGILPPDGDA